MKKFFVIIPVRNEEQQIDRLVSLVKKYCNNIIVVNDGSTDKTRSIIRKISGVKIINWYKNKGKGAAMKAGANLAWKLGACGVVFVDGDGQHDPRHLPDFFYLLKNNDIVIGIRKLKAKIPLYRRLGNELFILLMKLFFKINIDDVICGYRGFTKKGLKQIEWDSSGYGVETEMMTVIGRKHLPYQRTVIDTIYHDKYKGFSIFDGFKILLKLPYWRFKKLP